MPKTKKQTRIVGMICSKGGEMAPMKPKINFVPRMTFLKLLLSERESRSGVFSYVGIIRVDTHTHTHKYDHKDIHQWPEKEKVL